MSISKYIKQSSCLLLLMLFAKTYAGAMNEEQMQQMLEQMQKMQACMAGIDQSGMDRLAEKGKQMELELKALCDAGKRDKAQAAAMTYGKEIANSEEMKKLKKCGEMAPNMLKNMPMPGAEVTPDLDSGHICDSY